jgi:hypothetical protein
VQGADLVSSQIRDYVLCPGQTYRLSEVNPDLTVIGGFPEFDYQILILNPNLKLSCDGCILEAAKPSTADEDGAGFGLIGSVNVENARAFLGPT